MATFDQLPAEQRAIIELVLQRGRSYRDLADVLGLDSPRVRELAYEALVELSPVTAARVDSDRRGQIADYVLGQQSSAEEAATKAHLRRSEAGRMWTLSLVDSLSHMYGSSTPEIPEAEAAESPRRRERERDRPRERTRDREPASGDRPAREPLRRPEPKREREPLRRAAPLSPEAAAAIRRRRAIGAAIAAVAAVILAVVLLSSGGSDHKKAQTTATRVQPRILGELLLKPVGGGGANSSNQGIAIVAQRANERDLIVQAKLPPTKPGTAYEVWLYNTRKDAVPVGAQVTDQNGNYQGAGKLPADLSKFQAIDVSLQTIPNPACQRNPACLRRTSAHTGNSVLRGLLSDMRAPSQNPTGATGATGQSPSGPTGP